VCFVPFRGYSEMQKLQQEIIECCRCPRLVEWREDVAKNPPARFRGEKYWARPVPSFGDQNARLLIVGLAPGAHGSNRTGRMFTGDRSGQWLFRALHKAGFANQATWQQREDGLQLHDCWITAAIHCAPPANKPLPEEIQNCRPFLLREMALLNHVRVILGLGKIGFDAAFNVARTVEWTTLKTRPKFSHGAQAQLNENLVLLGTFHPSQQNTFTGKLTEPMLDAVFDRAKEILSSP
jgi:uracil-DNA glycosylase family 4